MESISLGVLLEVLARFGLAGVILIIWHFDGKRYDRLLCQYRRDMQELRDMYEKNVILVKSYERMADELHDVVILNTQAVTGLVDSVKGNQFCPMVRLKKDAIGEVA